jgi:hypothetical protein
MLIEAFHLLAYFASVSSQVVPALRDRAMNYMVNLGFDQEMYAPGVPRDSKAWLDRLIPRDYHSVLTGRNLEGLSGGAGVAPPSPDRVLELNHVGLWMTLHARPGTANFVHGIVMNHAFGIHQRSLFGYRLMRALAPCHRSRRVTYVRHFAVVIATPGLYREAIDTYNWEHPDAPFNPIHTTTASLR